MELRALSWNLYHGRDFPPDRALFTRRSRVLGVSERNDTHAQVNRDLSREFEAVLAAAEWDVALLQECPPRWWERLGRACYAEPHGVLTSRNSLGAVRAVIARINPDLIGSNEGGSNLTLVRSGTIVERRALELQPGPRPERRMMAFTRLAAADGVEICVANLHLSAGAANRAFAEAEVIEAARRGCELAGEAPLLLGGDLNLRPRDTGVYEALAERFGLAPPTASDSLDHLLIRGLRVVAAPTRWPPERREVRSRGSAIRLSDHPPVEAAFG